MSSRIERFLIGWANIGVRWPRTVLCLAGALLLLSGIFSAMQLKFDSDTSHMLSEKLAFRQAYSVFQAAFPQFSNTLLIVIDGQTPEQARRAVRRVADRLRYEQSVFRDVYLPRANDFMLRQGLLYQPIDKLETLADELAGAQPWLGMMADDASLHTFFTMLGKALTDKTFMHKAVIARMLHAVNKALDANLAGRAQAVSWESLIQKHRGEGREFLVTRINLDFARLQAAAPAIERVRRMADELHLDAAHGVRMRLTGGVAMNHEELGSIQSGLGLTGGVALAAVMLVLFAGLKSGRLVASTLFTLLVGLLLTAAFATAVVGRLNLISVAFAVLYIGLSVDYAIHFSLQYQELQEPGKKTDELVERTLRRIGLSLVLCVFTTAIGFFCFVPTAYAGVSELGLIAGAGMFIGLLVTLIVLPACFRLFPPPPPRRHDTPRPIQALLDWPLRRQGCVRIVLLMLAFGALWFLPQARFDYNPVHLRSPDTESVATFLDLSRDKDTSPWRIMVLAPDADHAAKLAAQLQTLPGVDKALYLDSFIPANQQQKLPIIEDMALMFEATPEMPPISADFADAREIDAIRKLRALLEREVIESAVQQGEVARLRLLLGGELERLQTVGGAQLHHILMQLRESLFGTLPPTLSRLRLSLSPSPVALSSLPENLRRRWVSPSGLYRIEVAPREDIGDNDALRRFVREVQSIAPQATGAPVFTFEAGKAVVRSFQQAFAAALAAILLLLLMILRSLRDSLLIVGPLLFAFALLNAVVLMLGVPFNFANIIALPLLLGMGVDNGVHMVNRARNAMPESGNLLHTATARAVLFSALTTLCSFGALSFSPHVGTASMGKMLSVGVCIILVGTLIARPALFARFNKGKA